MQTQHMDIIRTFLATRCFINAKCKGRPRVLKKHGSPGTAQKLGTSLNMVRINATAFTSLSAIQPDRVNLSATS